MPLPSSSESPSGPPRIARSRVPLLASVLLIVGCALVAYWATAASGDVPPAFPARTTAASEVSVASPGVARRIHVPLSPMAHDVQALGGRSSPSARSWEGLRVRLPASLPPPVRLPSVPITVPFQPGHFADYDTGLDGFELEEVFEEEGSAPLLWIAGDEDAWLTPGFRVADFASRDGSTLARISYQLVDGLEQLRQRAGSLGIISGYRNAAHNAAVGGVAHSQHLAGKAADVWSGDYAPLDLARLALQTLGCEIGLGLGPRSLHVDVRGDLVTWTYPGAAMPNAAFDAWALAQCGLPVPPELAQQAAEAWLSETGGILDTLDASPTELLARYHTPVVETARAGYALEGPGAVVLDLRAGVPPSRDLPSSLLRYVPAGTSEAADLGVGTLIAWRERGHQHAYFVYAVLTPGAPPAVGVSSFAAPRPLPPREPTFTPALEQPAPGDSADGLWTIVVASHADRAQAEAVGSRYRDTLRGHRVAIHYDDEAARYRVTAGQFRTSGAAQSALNALGPQIPSDAWVNQL